VAKAPSPRLTQAGEKARLVRSHHSSPPRADHGDMIPGRWASPHALCTSGGRSRHAGTPARPLACFDRMSLCFAISFCLRPISWSSLALSSSSWPPASRLGPRFMNQRIATLRDNNAGPPMTIAKPVLSFSQPMAEPAKQATMVEPKSWAITAPQPRLPTVVDAFPCCCLSNASISACRLGSATCEAVLSTPVRTCQSSATTGASETRPPARLTTCAVPQCAKGKRSMSFVICSLPPQEGQVRVTKSAQGEALREFARGYLAVRQMVVYGGTEKVSIPSLMASPCCKRAAVGSAANLLSWQPRPLRHAECRARSAGAAAADFDLVHPGTLPSPAGPVHAASVKREGLTQSA
jgi:hypothetical protein